MLEKILLTRSQDEQRGGGGEKAEGASAGGLGFYPASFLAALPKQHPGNAPHYPTLILVVEGAVEILVP